MKVFEQPGPEAEMPTFREAAAYTEEAVVGNTGGEAAETAEGAAADTTLGEAAETDGRAAAGTS